MTAVKSTTSEPIGRPRWRTSQLLLMTVLPWNSIVVCAALSLTGTRLRRCVPVLPLMEILADPSQPKLNFVNVGHPEGNLKALNGFQRRLVHQLVRKEFPTLRAQARKDDTFMQITELDVQKEAEVRLPTIVSTLSRQLLKFRSIRQGSFVHSTAGLPGRRVCNIAQYS